MCEGSECAREGMDDMCHRTTDMGKGNERRGEGEESAQATSSSGEERRPQAGSSSGESGGSQQSNNVRSDVPWQADTRTVRSSEDPSSRTVQNCNSAKGRV